MFILCVCVLLSPFCLILADSKVWVYDQTLDHYTYRPGPRASFPQRVVELSDHWKNGGPLLVFTGCESNIMSTLSGTKEHFMDLAREFGAMVIYIEHRYYGESLPFGNDSFTGKSLQYLTIMQATADYAKIIKWYKDTYNIGKVVTFGGSYSAMLAVWMRVRYPQLVDVAVGSSALFLSMIDKPETNMTWFESVTQSYGKVDKRCPKIVQNGYTELTKLTQNSGYRSNKLITQTFKLCKPYNETQYDQLVGWTRTALIWMAMANYPYQADFLGSLPAWPVRKACHTALEEVYVNSNSDMEALARISQNYYNSSHDKQCFDIYEEYFDCSDMTGCDTGPDGIGWDYQCCTELILQISTNNVTDMFPPKKWDKEDISKYCFEKYGVKTDQSDVILATLSAELQLSSNIVLINGLSDPWHTANFVRDLSPTVKVFNYEGGTHCYDIQGAHEEDLDSVKSIRTQVKELLRQWIDS